MDLKGPFHECLSRLFTSNEELVPRHYYRIYRETERRQRGLLYLQATSGGTASTFRRLDKAPTVDDDPSECIELSSRRSSAGRARSATASTAFVQPRR